MPRASEAEHQVTNVMEIRCGKYVPQVVKDWESSRESESLAQGGKAA